MLDKSTFYRLCSKAVPGVATSQLAILIRVIGTIVCIGSYSLCQADAVRVASSLSLYDEPKYPPDFKHFDFVNPQAPQGGKITLPALGTFDTLNPYALKGISAGYYTAVYGITELNEPLMVGTHYFLLSGDEPQSAYCLICSHIEYPANYAWVIFQLNPKARFHNGTPITAEDVAYSYELLMGDLAHPGFANNLENVAKVEVLSKNRVKFTFKQPGIKTSLFRAGELPVMSKQHWQQHPFGQSSSIPQPLSGPYRIKSYTLGNYLTLEKVKNHWASDHPVYRGMFNFDEVRFDFYRDRTVAFEALKSGGVDFWIEYVSKNWATGYDFPAVKTGALIKQAVPHERPSGTQAFFMNMRRDMFKDIRTRKALSLLFDFHWINKNIFSSAYKRSQTHYPNSVMGARGTPSPMEQALLAPFKDQMPEGVLSDAFQFNNYDNPRELRVATRQAIALLKEAGWQFEGSQLVNSKGKAFEFEILIDSPSFQRVLLPYVKQLKKAGIQAHIRIVDAAQYKVRLDSFDFDMTVEVLPQSATPGQEQGLYFHSNQVDVRGSRNLSGVSDPVVDALIDRITKAQSHKDLVATVRALDRVLLWNYYMIPNWHLDYHRLAYKKQLKRPETPPKFTLGFQTWWIDQQK